MAQLAPGRPILLRAEEGARLMNVSRSKFFLMMQRGEVPGVVRFGRSVRISRRALEAWIAEQTGEGLERSPTTPDAA